VGGAGPGRPAPRLGASLTQTAFSVGNRGSLRETTGAPWDGRDDDGYVQATVGDENACITLPESGDDIDVSGGACPAGP